MASSWLCWSGAGKGLLPPGERGLWGTLAASGGPHGQGQGSGHPGEGVRGTWLWEQRAGTVALVSVAQFALVHSSLPAVAKENPQPGEGTEPGAAPKKRKKKKQRVKE